MRVVMKNNTTENTIKNLDYGDLFEFNGEPYMIIRNKYVNDKNLDTKQAINLKDNYLEYFKDDTLVKLIEGTFFYKYVV